MTGPSDGDWGEPRPAAFDPVLGAPLWLDPGPRAASAAGPLGLGATSSRVERWS
jgi:hypothetical protein